MAAFDEIQSYLARRIFLSYKNKREKGSWIFIFARNRLEFRPTHGFSISKLELKHCA